MSSTTRKLKKKTLKVKSEPGKVLTKPIKLFSTQTEALVYLKEMKEKNPKKIYEVRRRRRHRFSKNWMVIVEYLQQKEVKPEKIVDATKK